MEEARAMLDALMGPSRNATVGTDSDVPDFADDKVCKNFLVGFCPHDWFTGSRRRVPACSKIHSELLREKFEDYEAGAREKYRRRFEEEFLRYLEGVTRDCDLFIGREKIRCRPKGAGGVTTRMPSDIQELYDRLEVEHQRLVKEAEGAADESLSRSEELTRKALEVEEDMAGYRQRYRFEFPGEEACEVCGVRYAMQGEDNPHWHDRASHLNGKMHHGWLQIRQKLRELREKERVWEREDYQQEQKREKTGRTKRRSTSASAHKRSSPGKTGKDRKRHAKVKKAASDSGKGHDRSRSRKKERKEDASLKRKNPEKKKERKVKKRSSSST